MCEIGSASWEGSKWLYHVGQVGVWVVASSATILALPVMFESERNQMEEQQIQQQRQVSISVCHRLSSFTVEYPEMLSLLTYCRRIANVQLLISKIKAILF